MYAFIRFNKGILKMPLHWKLWLLVLVAANVVTPLMFLERLEARVVLATILVSFVLMTLLTARFGFTRIVGLGHIVWIPMLAFLSARLSVIPPVDAFGYWIRALFVLNGLSLMIDAADVVRYIDGERSETVPGL